jgi:hypothetical protein
LSAPQFIQTVVDANGIPLLIQVVTGALLTIVPKSTDGDGSSPGPLEHHVHFDAVPSDGQLFPVVQNEGVIALILLANGMLLPLLLFF